MNVASQLEHVTDPTFYRKFIKEQAYSPIGREIMIKKKPLNIFRLSPEKVPESVQKRPFVILCLAVVVFVSSVMIVLEWFEGEQNLFSFLSGCVLLIFSISAFYLWFRVKYKI